MNRARYYISFNAGVAYSEFFPSNVPKVNYNIQAGEIFKRPFIDKFRIARTQNATVYDTIKTWFFDDSYFGDELWFKISVLGTDKFYFIGPVTDGKLDDQNDVYEVTPEPRDTYRNILKLYEKKWQDRTAGQLFGDADTFHYPVLNTNTFPLGTFTTLTDSAIVGSTYRTVSYTNSGVVATSNNQLAVVTNNTDKVIIIIQNYTLGAGADPRMQLVDAGGVSKSNQVTINADGKYTLTQNAAAVAVYVELFQNNLVPVSSASFDYRIYYPDNKISGGLLETALGNVLNGAAYMNLGLTIVSSYLWNDALPTGHAVNIPTISTYFTANPTNDYVIEGSANWNGLWLARNDAFTTVTEDITEISLKDILDYLKIKLRAWWYIDEDGSFRIEHEYWFRDYIVQADLTSATYTADQPETNALVYSYEKGDVYSQLNYAEKNQYYEDWLPYPVEFSTTLTSENKKDISSAYFGSNIEYLLDYPDDAESVGWTLLRCIAMGANWLVDIDESTITAGNFYMNARLGWAYLFANYWDYFAEADAGTVNDGAHTFVAVKTFLKQNNVKFRMTSDYDWKKPFTMLGGKGWPDDCEYIPDTGMYTINVGFDPYV